MYDFIITNSLKTILEARYVFLLSTFEPITQLSISSCDVMSGVVELSEELSVEETSIGVVVESSSYDESIKCKCH